MSIKIPDNDGGHWRVARRWVDVDDPNLYHIWHIGLNNKKYIGHSGRIMGDRRCSSCNLPLPDNFKTIAVLYSLPIEAELRFYTDDKEKYKGR